jgi:hypothetical protein
MTSGSSLEKVSLLRSVGGFHGVWDYSRGFHGVWDYSRVF